VVDGGDTFTITLANQKNYHARLIGQEPNKDIAVLRIVDVEDDINPIHVGSSSDLLVGQKVIAIGNPFGFDQTVTTGIISSVGRKIQGYGGVTIRDMIQTDASINPGNSGGPLLNSDGELIGMNTLIYSSTGTSSGIGFAVPVNTIKRIVPQLIQYGKVIRPGLGVSIISDQVARRSNVMTGVIVGEATRGGNAYQAGIRGLIRDDYGRIYIQDVIIGIDNIKIKSYDDLYNALDRYKIGDVVTVTLERNDKVRKVKVRLTQVN
jgi:S1-C subfamily serine protease